MKKTLTLLVVAMFVSSIVGCGCCRRARDWICRGAICSPAPATVAAPQPIAACPSCPPVTTVPVTTSYDPGCQYYGEQTYGYPMDSGVIDSGWSSSCPGCEGPSYSLPSDSSYPSNTTEVFPGPADNGA